MSGCDGFILVCDITNDASFRELYELCAQVWEPCQSPPNPTNRSTNSHIHDTIPTVVVINKVDLESEGREYDGLAADLLDQYKGRVFRTSAKTGVNVDEVFFHLVAQMVKVRDS